MRYEQGMKVVAFLLAVVGLVQADECARRIFDAQQAPIAPITVDREISVSEAYEIQSEYNALMEAELGSVVGYKVAYASKASQEKWGIEAPTFGTFFRQQQVLDGGSVQAEDFLLLLNETEIAFTISRDITHRIETVEELMPYIASVHAGLDVPNNRFDRSQGAIQVADVIAMSCATHTYVIGEGVAPDQIDFTALHLTLEHDGQTVYEGESSNVMGDPRRALLLLSHHLLDQGSSLRAGDVVLSGAVAAAYVPPSVEARKGQYVGHVTGLPDVSLYVK